MDEHILLAILVGLGGLILFAAWDRWVAPKLARRRVRRLLRRVACGERANTAQSKYAISFDAEGFAIRATGQAPTPGSKMYWSEVQRVTAFKRDCFVVDCIFLVISARDDTVIEINEEMAGWREFVETLPDYLLGCKPWYLWFSNVAFPAFATNPTAVYERQEAIST
jgi:hypothetical protein